MNRAQIFTNAWNIARTAATKFGGAVKSFFIEALKMAYKGEALSLVPTKAEIESLARAIFFALSRRGNGNGEARAIACWVRDNGTGFAAQVAETVARYGKASEKQAWHIASGAVACGIAIEPTIQQLYTA